MGRSLCGSVKKGTPAQKALWGWQVHEHHSIIMNSFWKYSIQEHKGTGSVRTGKGHQEVMVGQYRTGLESQDTLVKRQSRGNNHSLSCQSTEEIKDPGHCQLPKAKEVWWHLGSWGCPSTKTQQSITWPSTQWKEILSISPGCWAGGHTELCLWVPG